ncbi:hypothetical protein WN51_06565 [Melipona quadrifasciata]|uniref:Uncharacterized protein n=1 Tax=Melipona quadrifasciata TaxID=166423 RepID=A0A0N0BCT8_9HYME|nr:hypothetical protein WN51_06565 [Melipona quadrifasciata]
MEGPYGTGVLIEFALRAAIITHTGSVISSYNTVLISCDIVLHLTRNQYKRELRSEEVLSIKTK